MDSLTLFGLFAVTAMMVCYALESRSRWFVLAFAGTCVLTSAYGFLQGAWPFGVVEGVLVVGRTAALVSRPLINQADRCAGRNRQGVGGGSPLR